MKQKIRYENGFTLIELIVVISIIGILSSISLPKFVNVVQNAKYAKLEGAMGAIKSSATTINLLYIVSGGNNTKKSDKFYLNNGTQIKMRYGYPKGPDIMKYTKLTDYNIITKANRVDIRIKPKDKTFLRYNPQ